jgi:hypothetical protein
MNDIFSFFTEQTTLMQIFWGSAIISTVIMLIQTILSLIGMSDLDLEVGVDGGLDDCSGADLFTIKNIVNFFVGFGWTGVSFRSYIESDLLLVLISLLVGVCFVIIFIIIFKQLMKLESNSAVGADACVGRTADVYLRIPANRSGKGKIQLSLNGAAREFDAVTDESEPIPSGAVVTVQEVVGKSLLLVKRN